MQWAVTDLFHHPPPGPCTTHHYHGAVLCRYHPCHFTANSSWVLHHPKFLFCFSNLPKKKNMFLHCDSDHLATCILSHSLWQWTDSGSDTIILVISKLCSEKSYLLSLLVQFFLFCSFTFPTASAFFKSLHILAQALKELRNTELDAKEKCTNLFR